MTELANLFFEFLSNKSLYSYLFILTLGLLIGSFLNVVIYRLPIMINNEYIKMIKDMTELPDDIIISKMTEEEQNDYKKSQSMKDMNLSLPRSRCSNCGYNIPIWQNLPVISYLLLKGKCFFCRKSYSSSYLFVELMIGLFFCFSFYKLGASIDFIIITSVTTALIASFFIDLRHKILPDQITLFGVLAALFYNLYSTNAFITPLESFLGMVIGFLVINTFIKLYEKLRNIGTMMGDGDIKLFALCGAWFGLYNLIFIVIMSCLLGVFIFLCFLIFKKKNIKNYELPFGPYIIIIFFAFVYYYNFMESILLNMGFL